MSRQALTKIVFAEDEDDIRSIAQIALEDIGNFNVKYCSSGCDVLNVVKTFIPDLFLLDVMMPEMDGIMTLKELRKNPQLKNIPAIFMTAKIQTDEIQEYKSIGVLEVIEKPFDPMKLAADIKEVWAKKYGL